MSLPRPSAPNPPYIHELRHKMVAVHSIQLQIDAAAAKTGAAQFQAAINAVKAAVQGLEKDTTGAFKGLKVPKLDTTGLVVVKKEAESTATAISSKFDVASQKAADAMRRLAIQSANSLRASENAAQRLVLRLDSLGDTQGIGRITAQLTGLRASLGAATSTLDVRESKVAFDDVQSSLNRASIAAQTAKYDLEQLATADADSARSASIHAASLEKLRHEFVTGYTAGKTLEGTLERIAAAEREGILTTDAATAARLRASASMTKAVTVQDTLVKSAHSNMGAITNVSSQFQDIGVMLAAGQNPIQLAMQQGTQLSMALQSVGQGGSILRTLAGGFMMMVNPISLVTIGLIAGGAALYQWATASDETTKKAKPVVDLMNQMTSAQRNLESAIRDQVQPVDTLREKYGNAAVEMAKVLALQTQIATNESTKLLKEGKASIADPLTLDTSPSAGMADTFARMEKMKSDLVKATPAGLGGNTVETMRINALLDSMRFVQANVTAIGKAYKITDVEAERLAVSAAKLREASSPNETLAAAKGLEGVMVSIFGSAEAADAATDGLYKKLVSVHQTAIELGGSLDRIPGSVGVSVSVSDTLMARLRDSATAAQNIATANIAGSIAAGIGPASTLAAKLWDAANAMAAGRIAGAEVKRIPGGVDALANGDMQYSGGNFHRPVKAKVDTTTGGTGGGARLIDGQKVIKDITERTQALDRDNQALTAQINSTYTSEEAAKLYGEAMVATGGKITDATRAQLAQIDASARLSAQLKKAAANPLRDYIASLPTAVSATRQASADIASTLREGISSAMTGDFNLKGLVDSLRHKLADGLAGALEGKLMGALGLGDTSGSGAYSNAILTASQQGAQMYAAAISGGGAGAGAGVAGAASGTGGSAFGGGLVGGALTWISHLFGMSEGGISGGPGIGQTYRVSPSAFHGAPHYAEGTANTTGNGIPSILHPNEAVIPLSRGRSVPVTLSGQGGNSGTNSLTITNNITVDGGGAANSGDSAQHGKLAETIGNMVTLKVQDEMANQMRYGGMYNPRGGR